MPSCVCRAYRLFLTSSRADSAFCRQLLGRLTGSVPSAEAARRQPVSAPYVCLLCCLSVHLSAPPPVVWISRWMDAIRRNTLKKQNVNTLPSTALALRSVPLSCLPEWAHLGVNTAHWLPLIKQRTAAIPSFVCGAISSCVFLLTMFTKDTGVALQSQPLLIASHGWRTQFWPDLIKSRSLGFS